MARDRVCGVYGSVDGGAVADGRSEEVALAIDAERAVVRSIMVKDGDGN